MLPVYRPWYSPGPFRDMSAVLLKASAQHGRLRACVCVCVFLKLGHPLGKREAISELTFAGLCKLTCGC